VHEFTERNTASSNYKIIKNFDILTFPSSYDQGPHASCRTSPAESVLNSTPRRSLSRNPSRESHDHHRALMLDMLYHIISYYIRGLGWGVRNLVLLSLLSPWGSRGQCSEALPVLQLRTAAAPLFFMITASCGLWGCQKKN
jgi:hypothetical protein